MKLKELLHGLDVLELHADEALDITGVQYDSRQVTPGALFVAISGFQTCLLYTSPSPRDS